MRRLQFLCADLILLALATGAALLLRDNLIVNEERVASLLPYLAVSLAAAVPIFTRLGLSRTVWHFSAMIDYLRVGIAVVSVALVATVVMFAANRMDGVARSIPVLQALVASVAMIGARVAVRLWNTDRPTTRRPVQGVPAAGENVLLVGLTSLAELYIKALEEHADRQQSIAGIVDYDVEHGGDRVHLYPLFGPHKGIGEVIEELAIHGVFVDRVLVTLAPGRLTHFAARDVREFTHASGIPVEFLTERLGLDPPGKSPSLSSGDNKPAQRHATLAFKFSEAETNQIAGRHYWVVKRVLDVVMAGLLLAVLWPLVVVVAVLVAVDVGFPALFWQQRPGVEGRPFKLLKFRTMRGTRGRDSQLLSDDERLSRHGKLLRKTRLDQLPQLWNILIGEMSFVGPPPLPIAQSAAFAARLLVRPGLTGWAQVLGGRDIPPVDKAALDVWYVKNASLKLDLEILIRTIPVILFGEKIRREAIESAWLDLKRNGICADEDTSGRDAGQVGVVQRLLDGSTSA